MYDANIFQLRMPQTEKRMMVSKLRVSVCPSCVMIGANLAGELRGRMRHLVMILMRRFSNCVFDSSHIDLTPHARTIMVIRMVIDCAD